MSWRWVDGVAVPDAVGGHPALDFCNTRAGWGSARPKEYLVSMPAFAVWVREAGLLTADDVASVVRAAHAEEAQAEVGLAMARARGLRDALYACLTGGAGPADWEVVSREAAAAKSASVLEPVGNDGGAAAWRLRAGGVPALELPVLAAAAAAEGLLTSALGAVVSACPGAGCGWLFADPRRRRRWCSMAVCGNRAKARRLAERRGGPGRRGAQGQRLTSSRSGGNQPWAG